MSSNIIFQKAKKRVIKICKSPKKFQKELYIYNMKLPFTPELLDHDNKNTLTLKYLNGIHIAELAQPDFKKISEMYIALHSIKTKNGKCICHSDNNPKNYLFADKKYYMLDFSDWKYDFPETDLTHFLLFWASIYDAKKFHQIFHDFIKAYKSEMQINPLEWEMLLPEVIKKFDIRRVRFDKKERTTNPDVKRNREILSEISF